MSQHYQNGRRLASPSKISITLDLAYPDDREKLRLIEGGWDEDYRRTLRLHGPKVRLDLFAGAALDLMT